VNRVQMQDGARQGCRLPACCTPLDKASGWMFWSRCSSWIRRWH